MNPEIEPRAQNPKPTTTPEPIQKPTLDLQKTHHTSQKNYTENHLQSPTSTRSPTTTKSEQNSLSCMSVLPPLPYLLHPQIQHPFLISDKVTRPQSKPENIWTTQWQLLEYESEVIECENILKFYLARSTFLYTRVWGLYWPRIFIKLTEGVNQTKTSETEVSLN